MKVGIIDADLIGRTKHRFPNLVCMKLSACERMFPDIKPYFDMKIDGTGTRKFDIQQNLF